MRPVFRHILFITSLITACVANAQVKFYATISPGKISKDEYATYRMVVENAADIEKVTPPVFDDFMIVGGPGQESGMSNLNGVIKRYVAITFELKPKKSGELTIGSAKVMVDGNRMSSNPVKLSVSNKPGSSARVPGFPNIPGFSPFGYKKPSFSSGDFILKKGEDITEKVERNMKLKLRLDKHTCYVGEPVVASYKLYTRLKSDSRLLQNPSFNGFSVIDIQPDDVTAFEKEVINGKEFNVYTIRKAQLYPLQPGTIEVESAELENKIQFVREDSPLADRDDLPDLLNDLGSFGLGLGDIEEKTIILKSDPEYITIKPLPEISKPVSFKGAVGHFSMEAKLKEDGFSAEKTGELLITISGHGNLQLITAPDVNWPEHLEPFEPGIEDDFSTISVPVSGKRTFRLRFSADSPGHFRIPDISFSFFDPDSASYKSIHSGNIDFSVVPGTSNRNGETEHHVVQSRSEYPGGNNLLFIIVVFAVMTGLAVLLIYKKRGKKAHTAISGFPVENNLTTVRKNLLEESGKYLSTREPSKFYTILNCEVKNALAERMGLSQAEVSPRTLDDYFERNNFSNELSLQLQQLLRELEWQLYTPFEKEERMHEFYGKALSLIGQLYQQPIS